jgi:histidine triad (HIT) family protein
VRTDSDCLFCKIVAGEIPSIRVFENDDTLAFMDINPANEGHVLAIPKEHWEDLVAVPDALLAATAQTAKKIAAAIKETLDPYGINLVQANGKGAAQSVFHFHMHILPRSKGDELMLNWGLRAGEIDAIKRLAGRISGQL